MRPACWGSLNSNGARFFKAFRRRACPRHVPPPLLGSLAKGSIKCGQATWGIPAKWCHHRNLPHGTPGLQSCTSQNNL
eukprot:352264-Chlamydomonas_euryale.AAC.1